MNIARILLWLTACVLAALVGMSSAVIANQVKHPATSAEIGIGPMGQVEANLAFASYAARLNRNPATKISERERAWAARAYRNEPLSSAALGMLIASTADGDARTRKALLDLGGQLTRRSSLITSTSIEAAAQRGDDTGFFRWLSRAILTNENLRATYIKAMAQATARSDADATLAPVVGPKPSWSDLYWRAVVSIPSSRVNAAKLRIRIAGAPWRQTGISDADRLLALYLARDGHFDTLQQLTSTLDKGYSVSTGQENLVANADFSRYPLLPPVDWQLASSGNLGATIEPKRKLLSISAISGARGFAARQLVRLAPGTYEMEWKLAADTTVEKDVLTARTACAEKDDDADDANVVQLDVGHRRTSLLIASQTCRWYWFSVNVNVPDASAGIDVQFSRLNLKRTGGVSPSTSSKTGGEGNPESSGRTEFRSVT